MTRTMAVLCGAMALLWLSAIGRAQQTNSGASKAATGKAVEEKHVRIGVTDSAFDDIGSVLRSMQIPFEHTATVAEPMKEFNCIFLGCSSSESGKFAPVAVQQFVRAGGVLYVSDLSYGVLQAAFPQFAQGWNQAGQIGMLDCAVLDKKLAKDVGDRITLNFDAPGWAAATQVSREVDVLVAYQQQGARLPVLFTFKYGKGRVVYTSFHNHANANALEQKLIRALVQAPLTAAKDIQSGLTSGTDIEALKEKAKQSPGGPKAAPKTLDVNNLGRLTVEELLSAVESASRYQAECILQELHNRKGSDATDGLVRSIATGDDELKSSARSLLVKRMQRMKAGTLERYLSADADTELRIAAAKAAVAKQERSLVPALAEVLGGTDRPAADAAHEALVALTGENFGPFVGAKTDQRFVTAKKWRQWAAENK